MNDARDYYAPGLGLRLTPPGGRVLAMVRLPSVVARLLIMTEGSPCRVQLASSAPSPLRGEGWDEGRVLAVARQLSVAARVPLTQRAFRTAAAVRVTFLLLAQKKSNPKKM
ncbi:hypothetical protein ACFO5W_15535, partial [Dyella halodurans]